MNKFAITILSVLVLIASVQVVNAQRRGETRYERLTNAVFTQPAYNGNPAMLENYPIASASELGITGREIYNEYPEGPVVVVVHAEARFYYDNGSREPLYLIGCVRKGRAWFNRVKLVVTTITVEKRVEVPVVTRVEIPVETRVEIPCPTCPVADATFDFRSTKMNRLFGVFKEWDEWGPSVGIGAGGSALAGRGGKDALIGGAASFGANWAAHIAKPDANRVKIQIQPKEGKVFEIELKRGESRGVSVGDSLGTASWHGDQAIVRFQGFPDCVWAAGIGENYHLTPVIFARGDDRVEPNEVPPKTYVPPGPGAGSGNYKGGKSFAPSGGGAGKGAKRSLYDQ